MLRRRQRRLPKVPGGEEARTQTVSRRLSAHQLCYLSNPSSRALEEAARAEAAADIVAEAKEKAADTEAVAKELAEKAKAKKEAEAEIAHQEVSLPQASHPPGFSSPSARPAPADHRLPSQRRGRSDRGSGNPPRRGSLRGRAGARQVQGREAPHGANSQGS